MPFGVLILGSFDRARCVLNGIIGASNFKIRLKQDSKNGFEEKINEVNLHVLS